MALGFCPYCSSYQNPLSNNIIDNELVDDPLGASIKSSNFLKTTFHVFTPKPTSVVTASVFAPTPAVLSTNNKLFIQFMKAYLKAQVQLLALAQI